MHVPSCRSALFERLSATKHQPVAKRLSIPDLAESSLNTKLRLQLHKTATFSSTRLLEVTCHVNDHMNVARIVVNG